MLISFFKDGRILSFGNISVKIEKLGFENESLDTCKMTLTVGFFQNFNTNPRLLQDIFLSSLWDVVHLDFEPVDTEVLKLKHDFSKIQILRKDILACDLDREFGFGDVTITINARQYTLLKGEVEEKTEEEKAFANIEEALNSIGVPIKNSKGEYRSTIDILTEVAKKWDTIDLNTKSKAELEMRDKYILTRDKYISVAEAASLGVLSPSAALTMITDTTENISCSDLEKEVLSKAEALSKTWVEEKKNCETTNKEDNSMNNIFSNIFGDIDFGKVTTSRIKYSMNGIAFSDKNSKYMVYKDNRAIDVTDMTIDAPLFAMPVAANQIKVGDIIRFKNNYVIVKEFTDDGLKIINPIEGDIKTIIPEVNVFNFNYYTKIISPFESIGATANENNPFGNFLPLMMLSGDANNGNGNDNNMLKYMMFSQMSGGTIDFSNPMMMYMLMGDKELDPMTLMFMNGHFIKVKNKGE